MNICLLLTNKGAVNELNLCNYDSIPRDQLVEATLSKDKIDEPPLSSEYRLNIGAYAYKQLTGFFNKTKTQLPLEFIELLGGCNSKNEINYFHFDHTFILI